MLDTLLYVFITLANSPTYTPPEDICKKNTSHLTPSNNITFAIGCSEYRGKRVYPDRILEDIYDGKDFTY